MTNIHSARAEILARIRSANQAVSGTATSDTPDIAWQAISRSYVREGPLQQEGMLRLLEERLIDYGAQVFHATSGELPDAIERILGARKKSRILLPTGIPPSWLPLTVKFQEDHQFDAFELDTWEGVLTLATAAIAATGTIVLQNGPGQGRRALTLVPDYHLCVVSAEQVVETVPEAFALLSATATRSTTFISGPSATADIEMTRIQGVHGPRFLDVILVGQP